jgi:hypothetical protein
MNLEDHPHGGLLLSVAGLSAREARLKLGSWHFAPESHVQSGIREESRSGLHWSSRKVHYAKWNPPGVWLLRVVYASI